MRINLTQNKYALIDEADYELVADYRWHFEGRYAATRINGLKIYLHSLLLKTPKGFLTDHINRDKLDNRRSNLKVCTPLQNVVNKSGNVGVRKRGNSYQARFGSQSLGSYKTFEEASAAYNQYIASIYEN